MTDSQKLGTMRITPAGSATPSGEGRELARSASMSQPKWDYIIEGLARRAESARVGRVREQESDLTRRYPQGNIETNTRKVLTSGHQPAKLVSVKRNEPASRSPPGDGQG